MSKDNKNFFKSKNHWSEIKDQLLGCYLIPYFQKVLLTGKPLLYVDCFAGKGKFEDGKPGSPIIALQARDNCLSKTTKQCGKIETCFIDLNHADALSKNISSFASDFGHPKVISGKYEDKIIDLLSQKHGNNVFLYIDPYGIKALDCSLFDKFETLGFASIEMLINFNSFGFFRDACRVMNVDYSSDEALRDLDDLVEYNPTLVNASKQSEELLTCIAGGVYWKNIVKEYQDGKTNGYQAEKRLSTEYKQRLRKKYNYVLDMPIRLKAGQRPKYRMIHACDHEDGCFLMAQNMQKRKDELFINVQQGGQLSLFDGDLSVTSTVENEIITAEEIRDKMLLHISRFSSGVNITKLLATFVNDHGLICEFKMIYIMLDELKSKGIIDIVRNPALTKHGHQRTFWEENKEQKIIIRKCK